MLYRIVLISFSCLWPLIAGGAELSTHRAGDIPERFIGDWVVKVPPQFMKEVTFPWQDYIKYPVKLRITDKKTGIFIDQTGEKCILEYIYYNSDFDFIPFKDCNNLVTEIRGVVSPMHLVSEKDGKIYGEVRTYKYLFTWVGERVQK